MDTVKSNPDSARKQTDTGRRSFMWKVGAGMSAVMAAAVPAVARPLFGSDKRLNTGADDLSRRVATLENEKSIRRLHKTYEDLLDRGMYSDVPAMFTNDAEIVFNGGVFKGSRGIKRLFCSHFNSRMTGKRIDPAPGFELDPGQAQDVVEVARDQKSAKARFTYSIQVGALIDPDSVLVQMARLHGEGIRKWWEGGVYDVSYAKDLKTGNWKIKRLEYKTLSRADFKPGRSCAKPISVQQFSKVYPADPAGPDRLVRSV